MMRLKKVVFQGCGVHTASSHLFLTHFYEYVLLTEQKTVKRSPF